MSKDCMRGADTEIASQCEVKSATHTEALNRSEHRSFVTIHSIHQALSGEGKFVRVAPLQSRNLIQVSAYGKEAMIANNNHRRDFVARSRKSLDLFRQEIQLCAGQPVCFICTLQLKNERAAVR